MKLNRFNGINAALKIERRRELRQRQKRRWMMMEKGLIWSRAPLMEKEAEGKREDKR